MRRRSRRRLEDTRTWVDSLVRSGLATAEEETALVVEALRADHLDQDAARTAEAWLAEARASWREQAATWPEVTDHDRLQRVFGVLEERGVAVLQGCSDHWAARDLLARTSPTPAGVAWFTVPDVWHAVDEGMLEVNLWHGTTANAAPGDALLNDVLETFAAQGLEAHFDEGRIEVAAHWQRRPPS